MKITVTKKQAATQQLETAIKLFFEDRDLISPYTLTAAAHGILEGVWLNEKDGINQQRLADGKELEFSFGEEWKMRVKPEGWHYKNDTQNFFKHADRDHDKEHSFDSVDLTAVTLSFAIRDYAIIYGDPTKAMSVFLSWYVIYNPSIIKEDGTLAASLKTAADMAEKLNLDRKQWCQMGNTMLMKGCPELFATPGFVGEPALR